MKIGFVVDDTLDKPDGVQQYVMTLGAWLSDQGHEVRYLVGESRRTDISGIYSLAKNVKVIFNGNRLSIPLPVNKKAIKRVLDEEQFDVLHVQVPYSPFFAAKVIQLASPTTKIVGTFHILPYGRLSSAGTWLLGRWLRGSLRKFSTHLAVSAPAAQFARKTFGIDCEISPNSVSLNIFRPKGSTSPKDHLEIMFLGRLVPRKGCQQLLEAVSQMSLPDNCVINICGTGPLRPQLETYVAAHNMSNQVKFHGFVTDDDKVAFMQRADIAVFPSLSGESFGIVLIEAMAAGAGVVLGGNNPGYESVLADVPGSIIDAHRPSVMARQLQDLIEDTQKRQRLHQLQQAHVEQFDTARVGEELLSIYNCS